jgi:phosphomannomutase
MEKINPGIFRAYDVRGLYPREINAQVVYKIAQAYVKLFKPKEVVLGRDVRLSSPELAKAAEKGLIEAGVDVIDIGIVTTDMLYFAVAYYNFPGGMVITGSHNPKEYNGIKIVKEKAIPVGAGSGMEELKKILLADKESFRAKISGQTKTKDIEADYLKHVLSFIDKNKVKPLKVAVNPNCGASGKMIEKIGKKLNLNLIKINFEPDGNFPVPEGRPDPLIPANSEKISQAIFTSKADLGVSWDSDADRCFFLDEKGKLASGYYTTAILAQYLLQDQKGAKIVHDPRLIWAIIDYVKAAEGIPVLSKAGHAYMKSAMIQEKALFGGEMSGHYFFKDNFYVDNGMIPFVLMLELLSTSRKTMSEIYAPLRNKYFHIDETNFEVQNADKLFAEIQEHYADAKMDKFGETSLDGISIQYDDWRANLRASNTEPLVRLNAEARDPKILDKKVEELIKIIRKYEV